MSRWQRSRAWLAAGLYRLARWVHPAEAALVAQAQMESHAARFRVYADGRLVFPMPGDDASNGRSGMIAFEAHQVPDQYTHVHFYDRSRLHGVWERGW